MILHNGYYGHNAILARFAGIAGEPPPIFGSVMHYGWQPDPLDASLRSARWTSLLPLFLWNREQFESAKQKGHRNIRVIGSPFAHLLAMEPDQRSGPSSSGTVVIAPHSSDTVPVNRAVFERIKADAEASTPAPWDLIVFYQDWVGVPHDLFERDPQWHVVSFGRRFDAEFLPRLIDRFSRRQVAFSGSARNTALLYAAALGLEPRISSELGIVGEPNGDLGPSYKSWEHRFSSAIAEGVARELASAQLGADELLEPNELREVLGWTGVRRHLAQGLASLAFNWSGWRARERDLAYPYPGPTSDTSPSSEAPTTVNSSQPCMDGFGTPSLGEILAVLLTFRRPEGLRYSLEAILPLSRSGIKRLLVVDNDPEASARQVVEEMIGECPGLGYLLTGANLGPAGGWGAGMSRMLREANDEDWVLLLDDDDPLLAESLPHMLRVAASRSAVDDVAAVGLGGKSYRLPWLIGSRKVEITGGLRLVDALDSGVCALYRVGALRDVGVFDESLFFAFEDLELGLRLRRRGYQLVVPYDLLSMYREQLRERYVQKRGEVPLKTQLGPVGWKRYYSLRNSLVITARFGGRPFAFGHALVRGVLKPLALMPGNFALSKDHLVLNGAAIRDAALGRMGRNDDYLPNDAAS